MSLQWDRRYKGLRALWLTFSLTALILMAGILSAQTGRGAKPIGAARTPVEIPPSAQGVEFFEKNVRPLLVENCYQCHAKANNMAMGGLQLDSKEAFTKGGKQGALINVSKPEKSLLLMAVSYQNKALQMPPKGKLSDAQIALLTQWVKMGAPWSSSSSPASAPAVAFNLASRKQHWAWQPIKPSTPPVVKNRAWLKTSIDNFILAKLEANHLQPAPSADKRTLLRRVTYDLIGLPPAPAEIDAFLADNSPNAYEKVVERLLASPHYGERWARHWLDLVRYAETDGHEFDFDKPSAWEYRDYVIRALNADMPFNQFVTEHIAGDLLATPRRNLKDGSNESVIATGFWWFGEGKHSPVDLQADEVERVDNQIDVFSKAFLGLSLGCARCHNHKFDAISTQDYYALYGFLKSSRYELTGVDAPDRREPTIKALRELQSQAEPLLIRNTMASIAPSLQNLSRSLLANRSGFATRTAGLSGPVAPESWEKYVQEVASKNPNDPLYVWAILGNEKPETFTRKREELAQTLQAAYEKAKQDTRNMEVFEDFHKPEYSNWFTTDEAFGAAPAQTTLLVDRAKNQVAGVMGPGVADGGRVSDKFQGTLRSRTFTISKSRIWFHVAGHDTQINLIIDGFQRIRAPIYGGLTINLGNPTSPTWMEMDVSKWIGLHAYIEFLDRGAGSLAVDRIVFSDGGPLPEVPNPLLLAQLKDPVVNTSEVLAQRLQALLQEIGEKWVSGKLMAGDEAVARLSLLNWMLHNPKLVSSTPVSEPAPTLASLLKKQKELETSLPDPRRVMALVDGSPEDEPVHIRGSYKTLGEVVPRRFLEAIAGAKQPVPPAGSGRLLLAQRLTDSSNPLLPRVLVNRIWKHHFGEGIVRSPDDFGVMGERPTHPELLDYLAAQFVRKGWSIKSLHRMMVLSNAYRMASQPIPKADEIDPQNRLLHRMPVRRLEAECIRDAILSASGRLDPKLYGASVMPYLTDFMQGRGRPGTSGPLDGAGRRSIYICVRRNFLTPLFLAFDYPVPFTTIGKRTVSYVPAQALALMNNPFVVQQAEVWAKRALAEPNKTSRERISSLYNTAFGRLPTDAETNAALTFLTEQDKAYGKTDDIHSWTDLCHVLFNVKEFIFIN